MLSLNDVALLNVIGRLRPREIKNLGLTASAQNIFIQDPLTRYRLLKSWSITDLSVIELQQYIPNITLQQISLVADYYYPIPESLELFDKYQLFANALQVGYTWEECLPYYQFTFDCVTMIYVYRKELLSKISVPDKSNRVGFLAWCILNNQYTVDVLEMLYSRHITMNMFISLIRSLNNNSQVLAEIESGKSSKREVLVVHYYIRSQYPQDIIHYPPELLDKCDINLSYYINGYEYENITLQLSSYNSAKYPSYDLLDDIQSGNILELLHKVNTYDRDIIVTTRQLPENKLQQIYWQARLETAGQALLHIHPEDSYSYLLLRGLEYSLGQYQYLLLQHWCYPNIPIDQLQREVVPRKAVSFAYLTAYYVPGRLVYDWDTSVIFERALLLEYSDAELTRYLTYSTDYEGINLVILCHVNSKYHLISIMPRTSSVVSLFIDIFTPDSIITPMSVSGNILNMIINHTYLTSTEKLDILSKLYLPNDVILGLQGYTNNPHTLQLAGNVLNAICPLEDITNILGFPPAKKLLLEDITISFNFPINASFPIGLLWTETTLLHNLQETNEPSYINDVIDLLSNITTEYPPITIQEMINAGDYYGIMSTDVMRDKPVLGKGIARSRFGYMITKFPSILI